MAKEYTLIGGNGTVVSPLEVTEDGDYVAGDSRAFNPVKVRTGGGGSSTLSGLTDVDISNPSDGQTLVYNATSGKWENGSGGGGGTPDMIILTTDYNGIMWTQATYSIIAGSYSAIRAKLVAHNPAVVCLCVEQSLGDISAYTEYVPFYVTLGIGTEEDYYIMMNFMEQGSLTEFVLYVYPDGTVSGQQPGQ